MLFGEPEWPALEKRAWGHLWIEADPNQDLKVGKLHAYNIDTSQQWALGYRKVLAVSELATGEEVNG